MISRRSGYLQINGVACQFGRTPKVAAHGMLFLPLLSLSRTSLSGLGLQRPRSDGAIRPEPSHLFSPGPPVSEAIRSPEHEVGGRLFVRTSRRVQLTPLDEKLRLGVEPAALVLRATLEECSRDIAAGLVDAVGHRGR
jgi:hypothetical protein